MLQEIRALGFEYAELSHGIRISLLPGIFQAVDAGEIRISTLHNFCPLPIGINQAAPNIYKFTSTDARERENAIRHSLKTIETAARVNARLVVLHLGCVEMKDYTDKLIALIVDGKKETPKYEKLCAEVFEKREERKEKAMQLASGVLHQLVSEAAKKNIKLGIENREALEEVPFESDFPFFFREFPMPEVRYWHDTGHAQIKENLGFIHHGLHLESLAERLEGFHIHDVEFPARDHRAPGAGMIDFAGLKPLIKPEHIKVFEFSPSLTVPEARHGVEHIKQLWGDE